VSKRLGEDGPIPSGSRPMNQRFARLTGFLLMPPVDVEPEKRGSEFR
jgi:hypothetical protein